MSHPGIIEALKGLIEVSNRQMALSESLLSYKSRRDSALIKRTRRQLRDLSKKKAGLLAKIRKG